MFEVGVALLQRWRHRASLLRLQIRSKLFDWWHGVSTSGAVPLTGLTIVGPHAQDGIHYEPVLGDGLAILMKYVPDPGGCTFVDFGAGKGRALLLASEYAFKRIIGIEFARELHEIAQQNIVRYRSRTQKCRSLEIINADAADFEVPAGPLVLFFYNPFGTTVMARVMENLERAMASERRDVWILCVGRWTVTGVIEQLENIRSLYKSEVYKAYHMTAKRGE
jgi:predicted RNA methylase